MAEVDTIRARHQEQALRAAQTGEIPRVFAGDPTFAELVGRLREEEQDAG